MTKRDKLDKKAEAGIFVGYNSISKAYKNFQPNTRKILISRDVHFMENDEWDWDEKQVVEFLDQVSKSQLDENELADDIPIRGMRSLYDIYQRCNMAVLEPTDFWEAEKLVRRPTNRKVIGVKWVFRPNLNPNGSINKHKTRLVVKGYAQIFGVDFSDTFAPIARLDTIILLLAIAA
ncbi:putative mitochondrial protein, partial [Mucuna pruriens]